MVGDMRHRIELQKPITSFDAGGGRNITWQSVEEISARVRPIKFEQRVYAMGVNNPVTHEIKIRYYPTLKESWRIIYDNRIFTILTMIDKDERKRFYHLTVEEGARAN